MWKVVKVLSLALSFLMLMSIACFADESVEEYELLEEYYDYRDFVPEDDTRDEWGITYQVHLASPEFDRFYKDGDAEAGLAEIVKAGEVYVNGYRIPYVQEDGSYSTTDFVINGGQNVWQVDEENDLWAWQAHQYWKWEGGPMGDLGNVPGYVSGQPVPFETAIMLYVRYMGNVRGQAVRLLAKPGEDYVSRIEFTRVDTSILSEIEENDDGTVCLRGATGSRPYLRPLEGAASPEPGEDERDYAICFPADNVDPALQPGDGVVFYELNGKGWCADRAMEIRGCLIENTDEGEQPDHHPYIDYEGERFPVWDSLADKVGAFNFTQFIKGYRRTDQFANETEVSMWCSCDAPLPFAFSYPVDTAVEALAHAVEYTRAFADELEVSEDGSDVPTTKQWVPQEAMDTFRDELANAEELLAQAEETPEDILVSFAIADEIGALGNAFGGREGNVGPGANNSLGIAGSAEPGTMK